MNAVATDTWISTPYGQLFSRRWQAPGARPRAAPIVLFHDSLGCVALWRGFPAALALATGRAVIAYDRPGFGQSDRRGDTLASGFVEDEAKIIFPLVLEQLGIADFIAFGHSVGGGMAACCAALHRDACVALVTESAQAFVEERTLIGIRAAENDFQQAAAFERLQRYHGDKTAWVLSAWIITWLSPAFSNWNLRATLPLVSCPTLVLHGDQDEYGSPLQSELIAGLVNGPSELELMAGAHHVPHREQESWVVERVRRFLALHLGPK